MWLEGEKAEAIGNRESEASKQRIYRMKDEWAEGDYSSRFMTIGAAHALESLLTAQKLNAHILRR